VAPAVIAEIAVIAVRVAPAGPPRSGCSDVPRPERAHVHAWRSLIERCGLGWRGPGWGSPWSPWSRSSAGPHVGGGRCDVPRARARPHGR